MLQFLVGMGIVTGMVFEFIEKTETRLQKMENNRTKNKDKNAKDDHIGDL